MNVIVGKVSKELVFLVTAIILTNVNYKSIVVVKRATKELTAEIMMAVAEASS